MIISRAAEYGLIAVGYIALHQKERELNAKVISKEFNISLMFLRKALSDLTKAGILLSKRGPFGGYVLAKEPEKISLLEIVQAMEEFTYDLLNFVEDTSNEPFLVRMNGVSNKANSEIKRVLSEANLAEMIGSKKK